MPQLEECKRLLGKVDGVLVVGMEKNKKQPGRTDEVQKQGQECRRLQPNRSAAPIRVHAWASHVLCVRLVEFVKWCSRYRAAPWWAP